MAYLPLPDGSVVTIREGENPNQAWARAIREYPEAFGFDPNGPEDDGKDKSGFKAAASAGASRLQGGLGLLAGKLGLMDSGKAEAYNKAKDAEAAARFTPTKDSWIESPFLKLKETAGGSLPNMAATMGAGAAAALAGPVVGIGAGIAGALGAGAASTAAFTGSNLQRQMEDGKSLDEASGTKAFVTAIPQAALDVIALRAIPGLGKIFGAAGKELTEEAAKKLVGQKVKELAKDYAWSTAKLMSKEGATEAAQAVLERAQAGLSITDPEARDEYFENFMGGAALAGALGPGGRYVERGQQIKQGKQMEKDRLQKEQNAAKADALRQEAGAGQEREQAIKQAGGIGPQQMPSTGGPGGTMYQPGLFGVEEDGNLRPNLPPPAEQLPPGQERFQAERDVENLTTLLERQRAQAERLATPEETLKFAPLVQQTEEALAAAQARLKELPANVTPEIADKRLNALTKQWEQAKAEGDVPKQAKMAEKLIALREQLGTTGDQLGFDKSQYRNVKTKSESQEDYDKRTLVAPMAQERERMQAIQPELEGIRNIAEKNRALPGPQAPSVSDLRKERAATVALNKDNEAFWNENSRPQLQPEKQGDLGLTGGKTNRPRTPVPEVQPAQRIQAAQRLIGAAEQRQLAPEDAALLERVKDMLPVLEKARKVPDPEITDKNTKIDRNPLDEVNSWLYRTMMGGPDPDTRAHIIGMLNQYDKARMSETQQQGGDEVYRTLTDEQKAMLGGRSGNTKKSTFGMRFPPNQDQLTEERVRQERLEEPLTPEQSRDAYRALRGPKATKTEVTPGFGTTGEIETAQQGDMFADPARQGNIFNSPEEFQDYSASNAVKARREAVGQTEPTAARVNRDVAALQTAAAKLRSEQAPLIAQLNAMRQQMNLSAQTDTAERAAIGVMKTQYEARRGAIRARLESLEARARDISERMTGEGISRDRFDTVNKDFETLLKENTQAQAELNTQEAQQLERTKAAGEMPSALEQRAATQKRALERRARRATRKPAPARDTTNNVAAEQARLERLENDTPRTRVEFEEGQTRQNELQAELRELEAREALLLSDAEIPTYKKGKGGDSNVDDRVPEAEDEAPSEPSDVRRVEALGEVGRAERVANLTKKQQVQEKLAAREAAKAKGKGRSRPELRYMTDAERSAELEVLSVRRENLVKDMVANANNINEKKAAIDAAWKAVDDAEAAPLPDVKLNKKEEAAVAKGFRTREELEAPRRAKLQAAKDEEVRKLTAEARDRMTELRVLERPLRAVLTDVKTKEQRLADETAAQDRAKKSNLALAAKRKGIVNPLEGASKIFENRWKAPEGEQSPEDNEEVAKLAEGQPKGQALGPVTRAATQPPRQLRAGTEESKAGENMGGSKERINAITEARGTKQANTEISKKEMAVSNEDAARFTEVAEAKKKAEALQDAVRKNEQAQQAVFDDEGNPHFGHASDYPRANSYDYSERRSTPLRPEVSTAVKAGDLTTALEELAKNASSPFLREAAAKLVPLLGKTKIKFSDRVEHNGAKVDAVYHHASNEIEMDPTLASEETLIHEATHAATMAALRADPATLTPEQAKARKSLEALFERLQKDVEFANEYGIKNTAEFVSEVLSNPTMRDKLDTKVELERGLLRKLYDAVLKLLGIETQGSAAQVTDDIYKLFQPSSQLTSGETVASILRGVFPGTQPKYSAGIDKETQEIVSRGIGRDATYADKLAAVNSGLAWRTAIADRWAPIEALIKRGVAAGLLTEVQALQLRLNMRNHEQAGAYIGAAVTDGVPQLTKDKEGLGTYLMQGKAGANLKNIGKILAGAGVGNEAATEQLFSQWMAIKREETVGADKLNYKSPLTPAERTRVMENVNRNKQTADAFEAARKEYKQYNTDLMKAMVDTGVITKELRDQLLKGDYMPFYRLKGNAVVMDLGTSTPVTIGNVVDQPYLKELVGGDDKILPFFSGAMQNTSLLMRTALRNLQAKDVSFMLQDLGYATIHKKDPKNGSMGPEGSIRFKHKGEDHWLQLDKDAFPKDIPPELVLQGMQGIKTAMPAFVKMMSGPANILRKTVTRMPLYAFRQMIRDPLHAWLTTGGDFKPVLSSFQQLVKTMKGDNETDMLLKRAGVISSNVMTGDEQDTARLLRDISSNKTPWNQGMAKLDQLAMAADATTRAVLYDSFRKQGMGHHEALLNTLESMNFSRRGSSASLFWLSSMIPFFNAQIQGADAVYRSLRGDTSFEGKMDARNQLLKRGGMIAGMTMAYALMMQDDEAYKNATPEERAMNWFVHTPFSDEPIRVPIPFELGLLFKALPEAFINTAFGDTTMKGAAKAIGKQLWMSTPLALPTAINPVVELGANYSFFSDQPIESQRERNLTTDQRYRPGTTEAAKQLGALGVLSPVQIEHLVRGYTGSMGITLMAIADLALRPLTGADEVPKADKKMSELAVLGPLFQPTTGRGAVNEAFKEIERFQQAHQSYKKLMEEGNRAEAAAFASRFAREIALASTGGAFRQQMGEIATLKRNIAASRDMDGAQKREQIERLKQVEIQLSNRIKQLATAE